jgi:choline O-acetyltransferase
VLDGLDNDADLEVFEFTEYGREFMKSCKCSPDVWLQLALQVL